MMKDIRYHPLVDMTTDGSVKSPMFFAEKEKTVTEAHKLYLAEIVPYRYRLCSSEDMKAADTTGLDIHCPYCGSSLKEISSSRNGRSHGLYICNTCTVNEGAVKSPGEKNIFSGQGFCVNKSQNQKGN